MEPSISVAVFFPSSSQNRVFLKVLVTAKMKPKYTPLSKLTDKVKTYTSKIKVIQKGTPKQTPPKARYQKLTLQDDEGAIFGNDIELYADAIKRNGYYEISNAPVKAVLAEYREQIGNYQITISGRTPIKPLDLSGCSDEPQYRSLSLVPRTFTTGDALIDVVAVVLYMSEIRTVTQASGDNKVRDIFLVDHSVVRPMKLSAWNHFAEIEAEALPSWHAGFFVAGFKGLCPVTTKGLSLRTIVSTSFISGPTEAAADALRSWVIDNGQTLQQWQQKCVALDSEEASRVITPLAIVESKKAPNLWQDEKFWVKATIQNILAKDVYVYIGCNSCGRRVNAELGLTFKCPNCNKDAVTSIPRATMKTSISDSTGSIVVTTFGVETEKLLDLPASDIYKLKLQETEDALAAKLADVKGKEFLMHLSPTSDLSMSNVLKWVVREVTPPSEESGTTISTDFQASKALQDSAHSTKAVTEVHSETTDSTDLTPLAYQKVPLTPAKRSLSQTEKKPNLNETSDHSHEGFPKVHSAEPKLKKVCIEYTVEAQTPSPDHSLEESEEQFDDED